MNEITDWGNLLSVYWKPAVALGTFIGAVVILFRRVKDLERYRDDIIEERIKDQREFEKIVQKDFIGISGKFSKGLEDLNTKIAANHLEVSKELSEIKGFLKASRQGEHGKSV